jgi:hypothetical protein
MKQILPLFISTFYFTMDLVNILSRNGFWITVLAKFWAWYYIFSTFMIDY